MGKVYFICLCLLALKATAVEKDSTARKKVKIIASFDGRYSVIRKQSVDIFGAKIGLEFNKRWRAGLGIYGLLFPEQYSGSISRATTEGSTTIPYHADLHFWYVAAYAEYVALKTKRWELSIPLQFGVGRTDIAAYRDDTGAQLQSLRNKNSQTVYLVEPSVVGHYKVFSWIGIGAGLGYRQMLHADDRMNKNFDNFTYILKVKLFPADLFRVLKGEKKWWG